MGAGLVGLPPKPARGQAPDPPFFAKKGGTGSVLPEQVRAAAHGHENLILLS